jgi:hypothetical protein
MHPFHIRLCGTHQKHTRLQRLCFFYIPSSVFQQNCFIIECSPLLVTKVKTEITSLWPNSKVFITVVVAFIICLLNTLHFYYEIHLNYYQDTDVYIDKSTIYFSNMENNCKEKMWNYFVKLMRKRIKHC